MRHAIVAALLIIAFPINYLSVTHLLVPLTPETTLLGFLTCLAVCGALSLVTFVMARGIYTNPMHAEGAVLTLALPTLLALVLAPDEWLRPILLHLLLIYAPSYLLGQNHGHLSQHGRRSAQPSAA